MTGERYSIYVIELDRAAWSHAQFRGRKPCVYVGSTGKSVSERAAEHISGGDKAARIFKNFPGGRLIAELSRKYALSREKAELMERELASELRRKGYGVVQG